MVGVNKRNNGVVVCWNSQAVTTRARGVLVVALEEYVECMRLTVAT